jgi:predicted transcriptional regulator
MWSTKKVDCGPKIVIFPCMEPEQVRAARNWLGWSQQELATRAHVGLSTIKDLESGKRRPMTNNAAAILTALEGAGMQITADGIKGPLSAAATDDAQEQVSPPSDRQRKPKGG